MDFILIIDKTFSEYLLSLNFYKTDGTKNEVIFESDQIIIRFIYHAYAFQYYYFIKLKQDNIDFESFIVEEFLNIKFEPKFRLDTQDEKIEYIAKSQLNYFKIFKDKLLMADRKFYTDLKEYFHHQTRLYNLRLKK